MTQLAETPVAEVPTDAGTTDRRKLALFGVLGALVLAAAGWLLLGGGGSSSDSLAPIPHGTPRLPKTAVGSAVLKPTTVLPPASKVKLGRDPFRPLYVVPAVVVPVAPATKPTSGSTGTTTPPAGKPATYALQLVRIDGSGDNLTAKFLIGTTGKIQYARAGSVFGRDAEIRLLSMQKGSNGSGIAVIQVGDGSPFNVNSKDTAIFVQ
jgi:hypothetical protein